MSSLQTILGDLESSATMSAAEEREYHAERERRARRENLRRMSEVITEADVERIVWDRVDTYASKVVRRFLVSAQKPNGSRYCWLAGAMGRGKTVAACLAIAIERGRYVTAENMCLAYAQKGVASAEMRDHVRHCRLLVVDDIGTERDHEACKHALHQLVNDRQGKGRLTIITGNASAKDVRAWLDPRTLARIEHQGGIVDCKGEDMRVRRVA